MNCYDSLKFCGNTCIRFCPVPGSPEFDEALDRRGFPPRQKRISQIKTLTCWFLYSLRKCTITQWRARHKLTAVSRSILLKANFIVFLCSWVYLMTLCEIHRFLYSGYGGETDVSLACSRFYGPFVRPRMRMSEDGWRWVNEWMNIFFLIFGKLEPTVEWYWQGKTEDLREKTVPVPLCPPQIPLDWLGHEPGPPRWEADDKPPDPWHGQCMG
jgi:hypothetical protein